MRHLEEYEMDSLTKNITRCQEALSLVEHAKAELMSVEKGCGSDNRFEDRITSRMLDRISEVVDMNELYLKYLERCKERYIDMQTVYGPPPFFSLNEDVED